MKSIKLLLAVSLAGLFAFQAQAATVTECGTDVCFTYDNSTTFGGATIVGNNIFFLPTEFSTESLNGEGAMSINTTLSVLVEAITPGFALEQFVLQERGDYFLSGDGASVTAGGQFAATSTTTSCATGMPMLPSMPCREERLTDAGSLTTQGQFDEWTISSLIDLTENDEWTSDSSVFLTIENRLSATTLANGEQAFIEKKIGGVGITVIPVPAAVWLLGSALGLLSLHRRRKN